MVHFEIAVTPSEPSGNPKTRQLNRLSRQMEGCSLTRSNIAEAGCNSLFEPRFLTKYINKKKHQLLKIQEELDGLPLDDPSRPRLLESMLYLQKGIPDLEELCAKPSAEGSEGVSTKSDSEPESASPRQSQGSALARLQDTLGTILAKLEAPTSTKIKGKKRRKLAKRDTVIFGAIVMELKAMTYCSFLHAHGIRPKWSDAGHSTYPMSYQAGDPWRKKVQDEKTRAKLRMFAYPRNELATAFITYLPEEFRKISVLLA